MHIHACHKKTNKINKLILLLVYNKLIWRSISYVNISKFLLYAIIVEKKSHPSPLKMGAMPSSMLGKLLLLCYNPASFAELLIESFRISLI